MLRLQQHRGAACQGLPPKPKVLLKDLNGTTARALALWHELEDCAILLDSLMAHLARELAPRAARVVQVQTVAGPDEPSQLPVLFPQRAAIAHEDYEVTWSSVGNRHLHVRRETREGTVIGSQFVARQDLEALARYAAKLEAALRRNPHDGAAQRKFAWAVRQIKGDGDLGRVLTPASDAEQRRNARADPVYADYYADVDQKGYQGGTPEDDAAYRQSRKDDFKGQLQFLRELLKREQDPDRRALLDIDLRVCQEELEDFLAERPVYRRDTSRDRKEAQ